MVPPKVLIADDDPSIRYDYGRLIRHDGRLHLIGSAHDGSQAVEMSRRLQPDVVIMDIRMPYLNGIESTKKIVADDTAKVLVVTAFDFDVDVLKAIKAGASGFLLKHEAADLMVDAAISPFKGDQIFNPTAITTLVAAVTEVTPSSGPGGAGIDIFTGREIDIIRQVATGDSNDAIARKLCIGVSTVRTHLRSVLTKLRLENRTQVAIWAYGHNLAPENKP